RPLTEEVHRRDRDEVLVAVLGDRARAGIAGEPRVRIARDEAPARREPIDRAGREARARHARAGVELRQAGARALRSGHAEEGLRVVTIAPGESRAGEDDEALAERPARVHIEARERPLVVAPDIGRHAGAREIAL